MTILKTLSIVPGTYQVRPLCILAINIQFIYAVMIKFIIKNIVSFLNINQFCSSCLKKYFCIIENKQLNEIL